MFALVRRRAAQLRGVEFCDGGQVCTPACRAESRVEQVRTQVAWHLPPR